MKLIKKIKGFLIAVSIPILLYVITGLLFSGSFNSNTFWLILSQSIAPAILAWGICFGFKVGLWDFSLGATITLSSILGGNIALTLGWGVGGLVLLCTLFGLLIGTVTGLIYSLLKIPSLIVSIGMMLILESICSMVFDGNGVNFTDDALILSQFPYNFVILIVSFVIAYLLYNYRPFGTHVCAIGSNANVADTTGIKVTRVKLMCFMLDGLFAGIYAFLQIGTVGIVKVVSNMGTIGVFFNALICVAIAAALERYVNYIVGIFIGAVTIQVVQTVILAIGFPSQYQKIVIGCLLMIFMGFNNENLARKIKMRKKKMIPAQ